MFSIRFCLLDEQKVWGSMSKAKMLLFKRSQVCKLLDIRVGQFEYWFPLFTPSDFDRRALTVQQTFAFSVEIGRAHV